MTRCAIVYLMCVARIDSGSAWSDLECDGFVVWVAYLPCRPSSLSSSEVGERYRANLVAILSHTTSGSSGGNAARGLRKLPIEANFSLKHKPKRYIDLNAVFDRRNHDA